MTKLLPEETKALQVAALEGHLASIDECITVIEKAIELGDDPVEYLKTFRKMMSDKIEAFRNEG